MLKIFAAFFFAFSFSSCTVLDIPARAAGVSNAKFEKEIDGRFEKEFEKTKKDCFDKTLQALKKLYARVTRKSFNKGYIIAFDLSKSFDYCLDSTEAAVFFKEIDGEKTLATVVCNNSLLAKIFSEKLFEMLNEN